MSGNISKYIFLCHMFAGVAARLITLGNSLESIENKMSSGVHGANPMLDQEWMNFYQLLDDWCALIDTTLKLLGRTQKEDVVEVIPRPKYSTVLSLSIQLPSCLFFSIPPSCIPLFFPFLLP